MGFKNLRLVKPPPITDEARWFAHNSLDVLENATIYNTLAEAINDISIVVGVTRRFGKSRGLFFPIYEGVKRLREFPPDTKIAFLFGREDKCLYNNEIEECGFIVTIPSSCEQPSLNLSQAVMVVAYEMMRYDCLNDSSGNAIIQNTDLFINHGELSFLYKRFEDLLNHLDYRDKYLKKHIKTNFKHFIGRAGITPWELKMFHGLFSQIEKKIKN